MGDSSTPPTITFTSQSSYVDALELLRLYTSMRSGMEIDSGVKEVQRLSVSTHQLPVALNRHADAERVLNRHSVVSEEPPGFIYL